MKTIGWIILELGAEMEVITVILSQLSSILCQAYISAIAFELWLRLYWSFYGDVFK